MTQPPASPEDQLELPASWAKHVLPRRGVRTGPPVEPDPEASKRVRGLIKWHEPDLRAALARVENAAFAPAALRHLDSVVGEGEPDAEGAGVIAALISVSDKRKSPSILRPELDAWVADHGLAFAVCAAITRLTVKPWPGHYYWNGHGEIDQRTLHAAELPHLGFYPHELGGLDLARGLLAAASEAEYAAVVAQAAAFRTDPTRRFITALLLPEQAAWTMEACTGFDNYTEYHTEPLLWRALDDPDALTAAGLRRIGGEVLSEEVLHAVVGNLGARSLPFLAATLRQNLNAATRETVLKGIALLPSDEATAYLVANLAEPHVYKHAVEAAKRFPVRTLRTAAAHAEKTLPELRALLAQLAARVPAGHRAALTATEREALAALLAADTAIPNAPEQSLPPLLADPPWTRKSRKPRRVVLDGLAAPAETRLGWAEGERDRWSQIEPNFYWKLSEDEWAKRLRSRGTHDGSRMLAIALTHAPLDLAATVLDRWRGEIAHYGQSDLRVILARFGPAAADRAVTVLRANPKYHEAILPILSVEAARLAADWFARLKSARPSAIAWIDRHGADGAALLIPDALGTDRKARQHAEGALALAALRHGAAAITAAAEPYGEAAVAAIGELLDGDPLEPRGVKIPKPAAWVSARPLPQVLLKGREHALPHTAVEHLVTVLSFATPDYPYPGLDVIAEALDRESLARFSRALFLLWLSNGSPSKDGWALTQLAHFGDDDTVRLLAPKVREWPGQSQHKRAVTGLGVLGQIGTEEALRAIQGVAEKVKFKALKEEARTQIAAIAAGLGLTREQLADRLVPDFGLGEDGALVLDYGPRTFTVAFDEQLKPYVTDETGKPRKALPKPGAKDDPEIAAASYKRFSLLKKELRTASADQVARLEHAMTQARTWTADEFTRYFATHPLVKHLARRLVWTCEVDGARTGFRIAEDGTFSDAEDEALTLPAGAVIGIAHPIHMEPKEIETWSEILADYEILQPFEQLGRPVMAFTEEELATGHLERFEGAQVEVGHVLGLTKHGWERAAPEDAGVEPGVHFPLPGGGYVTVALDPGIWVGMVGENPIQTFAGVRVADHQDYWFGGGRTKTERPPAIDPLTASEILIALARLTGRS